MEHKNIPQIWIKRWMTPPPPHVGLPKDMCKACTERKRTKLWRQSHVCV